MRVWRITRLPPIGRSDNEHSVIEGPIANKLVSRIIVQAGILSDFFKGPVLTVDYRERKILHR